MSDINAQLAQITESLAALAALQTAQAQQLAAVASGQQAPAEPEKPKTQKENIEIARTKLTKAWEDLAEQGQARATTLLSTLEDMASNDVANMLTCMFEKSVNQYYFKMRSLGWASKKNDRNTLGLSTASNANNANRAIATPRANGDYEQYAGTDPEEETSAEMVARLEEEIREIRATAYMITVACMQYVASINPKDPNAEWAEKATFGLASSVQRSGKLKFSRYPIKVINCETLTKLFSAGYYQWKALNEERDAILKKDVTATSEDSAFLSAL